METETLSTEDWLAAAKSILIRDGIAAVKIDRIAKECKVTRGGFYWRFKSRDELLAALLANWRETNTQPLLDALSGKGTPADRFSAAASLWIEEKEFDPRFDTAIRNWALTSSSVAAAVHEIDERRIEAFKNLFVDAGYDVQEALVRARIVYFHQVGYYALAMNESVDERTRLSSLYYRILTGFPDFR